MADLRCGEKTVKTLDPSYFQVFCSYVKDGPCCTSIETAKQRHPELSDALNGRVVDMFGNPLHKGDVILYGYNPSRSAAIKVGKIIQIDFPGLGLARWEARERLHRLRVAGVTFCWNRETKKSEMTLGKPGTLQFPGSVVKFPPEQLSANYREILDAFQP